MEQNGTVKERFNYKQLKSAYRILKWKSFLLILLSNLAQFLFFSNIGNSKIETKTITLVSPGHLRIQLNLHSYLPEEFPLNTSVSILNSNGKKLLNKAKLIKSLGLAKDGKKAFVIELPENRVDFLVALAKKSTLILLPYMERAQSVDRKRLNYEIHF
jgi:hypothetical protein